MATTTDTPTKPERISPRDRAAATDDAAWAIINTEAQERERKTEALRALRLQQEAKQQTSEEPKSKPVRRRAARGRG
ncbi:hypothetical protein M8R20_05095 [Pseudomonas sp. R2.Fl]|nr:hypothetical protein [Pseudomonas sp. R2.Fl]